ncbi:MAG: T9SS type A sorting domain-containing protein, partial [Candidatus Marinimicrobia bacterium]|nr:T9SS type A sorting domain-containing protein [Candidatus Neomarinimicrobiota bacterium]
KAHLDYIPDDIFIDEKDNEFLELAGVWSDYTSGELWDLDARLLNGIGSFTVTPDIQENRTYNIFFHGPGSTTDSARVIVENSSILDTMVFNSRLLGSDKWQHAGFYELESGTGNSLTFENLDTNLAMGIDVVRISPLITDKHLVINQDILTFGEISIGDSATLYLSMSNSGKEELEIISLSAFGRKLIIDEEFPLILAPMEVKEIPITFTSEYFCEYNDVIVIECDDPRNPTIYIPVFATSLSYYNIVDNDDATGYSEYGSAWFTSTAVASKTTSRCIFNHTANLGAYADFTTELKLSGSYDIQFIVPNTSNAHVNAAYIMIVDGTPQDTVYIDQNEDSGGYVSIGSYDLPKDIPVILRVQNNGGGSTNSVLRADAVKFILKEEKYVTSINVAGIPDKFELYQNYPNPFNPSTQIYFALPQKSEVIIDFFDLQGRSVDREIRKDFEAGYNYITWSPKGLASGIYLYRVRSNAGVAINKCTFVK